MSPEKWKSKHEFKDEFALSRDRAIQPLNLWRYVPWKVEV